MNIFISCTFVKKTKLMCRVQYCRVCIIIIILKNATFVRIYPLYDTTCTPVVLKYVSFERYIQCGLELVVLRVCNSLIQLHGWVFYI